ncbi:MAG: Flp pilus assembly protein CpaB [Planctomycetaceae bacterium]|nr:Flp pilus assembly protein CpaB [Planctomycetaceae bacterium]
MKMPIVILMVVGLLAATGVALLFAYAPFFNTKTKAPIDQATIVVASQTLSARTVVTDKMIQTRTVPTAAMPKDSLRDPVQLIGRVLLVSMEPGQAFTSAAFAPEGSGAQMAAALPQGKRAMSFPVVGSSGLRGLLYPGSVVDVLASMSYDGSGDAMSVTLLEGIEVLAVEAKTVYASDETPETKKAAGPTLDRMTVTVLVDGEQAQRLQLAMKHGTLSLALRNPLDDRNPGAKPTHLMAMLGRNEPAVKPAPTPPPAPVIVAAKPAPVPPAWETTVIRGTDVQKISFPVKPSQEPATNDEKDDSDAP